jgi:hypothetical protein
MFSPRLYAILKTVKDTPTTSIDISHHIQRGILLQLRQNSAQTYQQLKPDGVEGNAYNYHLRNLRQAKLISSENKIYSLTAMGQVVADSFSFGSKRLVLRPHAYTHIIVTAGSKVLLYLPTRDPLPNVYCTLSGKIHYGDSYEQSIAREMKRRDLTADYIYRHLCTINVRYQKDDDIVRQRPGTVWHIDYTGPLNESTTPSGSTSWFEIDALQDLPNISPEIAIMLARLKEGSGEPIELTISL